MPHFFLQQPPQSPDNSDVLSLVRFRMRQPVLPETLLVTAICFADMAWTITVLKMGIARESNPLLASLVGPSMIPFALVKMTSFLLPLGILEVLRDRIPGFVTTSMRFGLAAYILIYVVGSLHVHGII